MEQLTLIDILLMISIPGFFGGFISSIFDIFSLKQAIGNLSKEVQDNCNKCETGIEIRNSGGFIRADSFLTCLKNQCGEIIGKSFIGIAGAFGVVLVGYWLGQIKTDATVNNEMFLISLCMVAGTVSYRLLPKIGTKLEAQILEQKIELNEQKTENAVNMTNKAVEASLEYSAAIAHASTAIGRDDAVHDRYQAIERLEKLKDQFKGDRTLHIYLGRLYKKIGKFDDAILSLRNFIKNKNEDITKGNSADHDNVDISDAYFNIACYHILKAEKLKDAITKPEIDRLINEALDALNQSINLWPKNKEYASMDSDFTFVKNNEKFKYLTAQ